MDIKMVDGVTVRVTGIPANADLARLIEAALDFGFRVDAAEGRYAAPRAEPVVVLGLPGNVRNVLPTILSQAQSHISQANVPYVDREQ